MAGRKTKRIPDTETKICEALRAGNTRRASAEYAGIDQSTLYAWINQFPEFSNAVKKAESDCEVANVATIKKAALGHEVYKKVTKTYIVKDVATTEVTETVSREFSWQAAAWWLERRRPDDYKLRQATELSGSIDVTNLSDEELDALIKA